MKNLDDIKTILTTLKKDLAVNFHVKEVGIFGSWVHGEQTKKSDLDLLVEFEKPVGFFKFLELEEYLAERLGVPVDLVTKKALKPYIGKKILEEVVIL
jgi:predicted nucleotidyltransferase